MSTNSAKVLILLSLLASCAATSIILVPLETALGHPAALVNSAMEDNLPNELRNEFYKNPNIVADLAKESWFTDKEMQVIDRETDKIPREKIYNALHDAGLVRR